MDTAYNRRIASANDAIMERYARHAPANFVGRGFGSDSGLDTQYNDVMRGAANHPRALSQAEKEYRMEGEAKAFGGSFMDDLGQAFRYTPLGMASDAVSGRDTVFSGRGGAGYGGGWMDDLGQAFRYTPLGMASDAVSGRDTVFSGRGGAGYGGAGYGGASATDVGVTMPYREVPYAGVIDHAISGSGKPKFPLETKVQVGNSDGSGKPQVEAAWYENFDDFSNGRNRMRDSKKIGRMTKDPQMLASGGRDFSKEELDFVQNLFKTSGGAGFYGGEWYNDWGDFTEAVKDAYDTVKGVWEDYIKPVLDVVGTPLKDALVASNNPYGEAAGGVLELLGYGQNPFPENPQLKKLLGYGQNGVSGGMYGAPSGMSGGMNVMEILNKKGAPVGGMYGAPSGRSGGRARLVKGSPEAKAYMASIRAKRGAKGMGIGGMKGCGEGVFADAKPIAANSLGFSPKLEVEQLNAATGSTSYGDMPSSNPVGSGFGGRKRKIVPKNSSGVSSAPTKMGEDGKIPKGFHKMPDGSIMKDTPSCPHSKGGRDMSESEEFDLVRMAKTNDGRETLKALGYEDSFIDKLMKEGKSALEVGYELLGGKISRKTAKKEREGLLVSGDNSMGAIVAERGYSQKAQKKSGAVDEVASQNIWDGAKMENTTGRSAKKINNLILNGVTKGVSQGGAMSGGAHGLIQQNNLQAVRGGAMSKMKSEYSGKGQHGGKSAYNAFVSKTMKETGMKLAEAVKHIKQHGLYKK
jgi:hypothetical protein